MALKTQKAFAAQIGKSPQYVNKLVGQGKIVLVGGKVETKQALAALAMFRRIGAGRTAKEEHGKSGRGRDKNDKAKTSLGKSKSRPLRAAASGKGSSAQPRTTVPHGPVRAERGPAVGTITYERLRKERADADKAEMVAEQMKGSLLPAKDVLEAERQKNANIRAKFRQLPRALGLILSRTSEPAEAEEILRAEIDAVFSQLAKDPLGIAEIALAGAVEAGMNSVQASARTEGAA